MLALLFEAAMVGFVSGLPIAAGLQAMAWGYPWRGLAMSAAGVGIFAASVVLQ